MGISGPDRTVSENIGNKSVGLRLTPHSFCCHLQAVSQSGAGRLSLCSLSSGPWASSIRPGLEALATRAGGHQPGRALFPRNGLQWSVNGQILACHVTEGEKMSACFLYLMHKIYLNLQLFFFFEAACVVGGKSWAGASARV